MYPALRAPDHLLGGQGRSAAGGAACRGAIAPARRGARGDSGQHQHGNDNNQPEKNLAHVNL